MNLSRIANVIGRRVVCRIPTHRDLSSIPSLISSRPLSMSPWRSLSTNSWKKLSQSPLKIQINPPRRSSLRGSIHSPVVDKSTLPHPNQSQIATRSTNHRAHLNVWEEAVDSTNITLMLNIILHHLETTLPQGLITSMKGILLKGTGSCPFMCIPLELPFMASLFLYVRNNKLTSIKYSSNIEGFAFILNGHCS